MIKAIIFDVGGVLLDNPLPGMISHYSSTLGVDEENFEKVFFEELSDWQTGKIDEQELWTRISTRLNCPMPQSTDLWLEGLKSVYHEKKEVVELISLLKQNGYKLAMLSDTEKPVSEFLVEQFPDFDVYVFSCDSGLTKPKKEIYIKTLKNLEVKPDEAIFIDDRTINIEGAEKAGIKGILFESPEGLISKLKELDIIA